MTGIDWEWQEKWQLQYATSDYNHFQRKRPVKLRDREALHVLLKEFEKATGQAGFVVSINDQEQEFDDLQDLLDRAPNRIEVLHLYSPGDSDFNLYFSAHRGGTTWLIVPRDSHDIGFRILSSIEQRSRNLRWHERLGRFRVFSKVRPSVAVRWSRDAQQEKRTAAISSGLGITFGLIGGIIAAVLEARLSG